eukprot:6758811-Prymnesium_polylepis.1
MRGRSGCGAGGAVCEGGLAFVGVGCVGAIWFWAPPRARPRSSHTVPPLPAWWRSQGKRLAQQRGLLFVATSARSDTGIDFAFVSLLDDMLSRRDPERFPPVRPRRKRSSGGGLRCLEACLRPQQPARLGPDEFALSQSQRGAPGRGRGGGSGCVVM